MDIIVSDDIERINELKRLRILDTPQQACFDRITQHCAEIVDCQIALISLVDADRQWFLSRVGIDVSETPRDISFCNHAIARGCLLMVPDACKDPRFRSNPLVTAGPMIRSYLGQPIQSPSGKLIGTLCLADSRADRFTQNDTRVLKRLAKTVEDLISLHDAKITAEQTLSVSVAQTNKLKKFNRIFDQAEKVAGIGFWEVELDTMTLAWSDGVHEIHGIPKDQTFDLEVVIEFYIAEDRDMIRSKLQQVIQSGGGFDYEATLCSVDGTQRRVRSMGELIVGNGSEPSRLVGVVQDVTEAYHARSALQRAADHDSLTGVFNRHAFDKLLNLKIAQGRKSRQPLTLLLFDLDGFKDVNDTFGHLVGDIVLEETSARIAKAKPDGAILARWGGDEFALILPLATTQEEALKIGEVILKGIEKQDEISGRSVNLSATCGAATLENGISAKELMRRADTALYFGKKREPGQIHVYSGELEQSNHARQEAIAEVRSALSDNRLFAGYQPIVDLVSGEVRGFEALMRLNTKSNRKLTATQVLPAILDPIVSRDIGKRMLNFLCQDISRIREAYPDFEFVSLNSTEGDLLSRGFASAFLERLAGSSINPANVVLEVTETMLLVNDSQTVRKVLTELKEANVKIALDDFGTGFSSLSHLRDFPIDKVKIDKSFVQTLTGDHQSRLIVQALIGMARNMGIEVIAEGVETEEQRALLIQFGCRLAQGFLFSPAEDIGRLCLRNYQTRIEGKHKMEAA